MPTLEWIGKEKVINHDKEVPFKMLDAQYTFDETGRRGGGKLCDLCGCLRVKRRVPVKASHYV